MPGLAFLGGSFNPPHIGHFRLALEIAENFADELSSVVFLPCAHPPHKAENTLLPFSYRCTMLEDACFGLAKLMVSRLESERSTLSYTWDTLELLRQAHPGVPLYFILGADDYRQIDTWYRGPELPKRANFLVVPRGDFSLEEFREETRRIWPCASICGETAYFQGGGVARFQAITVPPVSATEIRSRFLSGKNIRFLVPDAVHTFLYSHADTVSAVWSGQGSAPFSVNFSMQCN